MAQERQQAQQQAEAFPLQQQQRQQAVQQGQIQTQAMQQQAAEQQALRELAPQFVKRGDDGKVTGYDYDGLFNAAQGKVSPQTIQTLQQAHAKTLQDYANLDKAQREKEDANNKWTFESMESLKGINDPTQRTQQYRKLVSDAQRRGMDVSQFPTQAPSNDDLTALEAPLGMHAQLLADAKTQAQTVGTPSAMESKYIGLQQKKALGQKLAPDDAAFIKGYERNKTLVPVANFNLQAGGVPMSGAPAAAAQGKTGQDIENAIPRNIRPTVMAVLEGRQSPPGSFALKTPYWQNVMNNVYAVDPQWNEQRAQLRKAYTLGPQSKEINAINTAMGHVGVLGDAIDALNNNNVKALNRIANALGIQVGRDNVTTFNTIVHRVGPELSKAYIGAGGSAGERGSDEKDFDPTLGPQQLKSNVAITAKLLRSKIGALENQWDQNKSENMRSFSDQFITPEAKSQLDKWSPETNAAQPSNGFDWSQFPEHK